MSIYLHKEIKLSTYIQKLKLQEWLRLLSNYIDSEGLGEDHKEYQHLISNKAKKLWSVFKELEEKFGE